jgi:hypothetical protein
MPKGKAEFNPNDGLIFQWRSDQGSPDSYCYHVSRFGAGYQILDHRPIATITQFEPMPGIIKFMGKVWEWNAIAGGFNVFRYEFADAGNCRSWLNRQIKRQCGDCEIVGGKRGRPAGRTALEARNKRERARRREKLRNERFAHIERLIAKSREPMAFQGLTSHQVIDKILDEGLDED